MNGCHNHNSLLLQQKLPTSIWNEAEVCGQFVIHKVGSQDGLHHQAFGTQKDFQQLALLNTIKACGRERNLSKGSTLHALLLKRGLLTKDMYAGTALLCMYARCGALAKAQEVFYDLPTRDVAAWNALISAFAQHGLGHQALGCFAHMLDDGHSPDEVTFVCILKACASIGAAEKGEEIHAEVQRQGLLKRNAVLGTALVDMYGKCGVLARAQEVFDELPLQDVVSWNALIAGYAQHGFGVEALNCYQQMLDRGATPNGATFACVLKACSNTRAAAMGKEIHAEVCKQGLLERNIVLATALVDMYAKFGAVAKAQEVFDELLERDVASWNALISGYAQNELGEEALNQFGRMQEECIPPDSVTFLCALKACGSIGAAEKGKDIHDKVSKQLLMEKNIELGNATVDMYAKCGILDKAQEVFDRLGVRTVSSWNALIAGYGQLGKVEKVFDLFSRMVGHLKPDEITFIVLLTACSHEGLLNEGQKHFDSMSTDHCIMPTLDHHACMIDLFSRAGHVDKAVCTINEVPNSDKLILCSVLLGACQKGANLELGRWVFERALHLDDQFAAGYVYMSNIYADADRQEEMGKFQAFGSED
ncbi:hypothetical protein GOP47_0025995 [Adiantum capillus-veneris]|uniref:Pentatricopeptide repeat-containing protein n=1 Tax=Adiantum capillus-veneris TaxID=13818 RepID=A0A9D4U139_ADICA|nr:hypothetical protein GOP47_0025995 [Adiantum capillus-veneris]